MFTNKGYTAMTIDYVKENPGSTAADLAKFLEVPTNHASALLSTVWKKKVLTREAQPVREGGGGRRYIYFFNEAHRPKRRYRRRAKAATESTQIKEGTVLTRLQSLTLQRVLQNVDRYLTPLDKEIVQEIFSE